MNTVVVLQYAPLITGVIVLGSCALIAAALAIGWMAFKQPGAKKRF